MPNQFSGPGMTLDKMRALGVRSMTCQRGREAIVDVSDLSGLIEVPTLRGRLKCTECTSRPIDVRPHWSQHHAPGRTRF